MCKCSLLLLFLFLYQFAGCSKHNEMAKKCYKKSIHFQKETRSKMSVSILSLKWKISRNCKTYSFQVLLQNKRSFIFNFFSRRGQVALLSLCIVLLIQQVLPRHSKQWNAFISIKEVCDKPEMLLNQDKPAFDANSCKLLILCCYFSVNECLKNNDK